MNSAATATERRPILTLASVIAMLGLMLTVGMPHRHCAADQILAPQQASISLPSDVTASRGLVATIEIAYQDIAGCVPLECTITSTSRFTTDRDFVLRLEPLPGARTPPQNGMVIEVPVSVAQGSKSVTVHRYVPKWSAGHSYHVTLLENGEPLPGHEGLVGNPVLQGGSRSLDVLAREYRFDWIFVVAEDHVSPGDETRVRRMLKPLTGQLQVPPRSSRATFGGVSLTVAGQIDLPTDWRGYQRYDMVVLSEESLQALSTQPDRLETLRQWVLCGGVVLGFDVASAEEFTRQLNFSWTHNQESRDQIVKRAETIIAQSTQRTPQMVADALLAATERGPAMFGFAVENSDVQPSSIPQSPWEEQVNLSQPPPANDQPPLQKSWSRQLAEEWSQRVWTQSAGAGTIVGLKGDQGVISEMHWQLVAPMLASRASPTLRRGVDPLIGDRRFSQWVIPGVAQPPVYTFIGLLTAFVILVGPIAYRKTTRHGRGYLMFAIAPVLAMVTTLAMFGYGVVADGFGTIARVRQLTWIDGASGDAAQRVRSTYFAGVRPGDGLTFPVEAEVIGYPEPSGISWEESEKLTAKIVGTVWVSDQRQVFDSSFLPSRQQRQFVVHQPKPGTGVVSLQNDAAAQPQLSSTLRFPLTRVVACDASGNHWSASNVLPGQTVAVKPLMPREVSKELGTMYTEHLPVSAVREARQQSNYRPQTWDLQAAINRAIGGESNLLLDGLFETWLRQQLQLKGGLPPRHFVGIAAVSDDVLAVSETELVESVHYVFGTMP